MRKIIALALSAIIFLPTSASAQDEFEEASAQDEFVEVIEDNEFEATVSADFVSRYMWRGADQAGPSFQPALNLAWKGLSLNVAGSTPLEKDGGIQDIDITLGYSLFGVNIGVIDYWTADVDSRNRYFYFGGEMECPHQLEANLGYTCKYGSLQAYTMFYGNDYKIDGSRAYSTYIELSVPFRLGGLDWDVRAGITPMESAGTTYEEKVVTASGKMKTYTRGDWFYGESFTCNMASVRATKNLVFKYFKVPVYVELHTNPYLQRANLVLGVSISSL
jgi:hypothetical protein